MHIILIFLLWLLCNFSDLLLCILLWTSTQALLRLSIRFINFETLSNSQFLWIALQFYFFSILVFDMWMLVGIPFTVIFSFSLWLALYYTIPYIIELLNASEASSNAMFFQFFFLDTRSVKAFGVFLVGRAQRKVLRCVLERAMV